jgi:asparagine synthase (glutamine-hydrolysing)
VFHSRSDTETLLKALVKWGADAISTLRGMYAFAYWRASTATLYVARDPIGVKPLYYRWRGGSLFFASEVKAFRALEGFDNRLSPLAVRQYLEFGYNFMDGATIFDEVRKLGPGEMLVCARGAAPKHVRSAIPGMELRPEVRKEALIEELHETLDVVVRQQMVADVPVGILLSGGLDSSVIAALAARRGRVSTLTMAFADSAIDERDDARRVAEHIGAQSEEIVIEPSEISVSVETAAATFDDIFADWGTLTTRLLYAKARERGVKVVLTGEGADEIFGGYPQFRAAASRAPTEFWLFQLYRAYIGRRYGRLYAPFRRLMRKYLQEAGNDRFDAMRLFETRSQLPNNYVMKVDKASMSVGVEARVPYLDPRVVGVAFRTPRHLLMTASSEKQILRDMAHAYNLLPIETVRRPKFGAAVAASWMDVQPGFRIFAREVILAGGGWTDALGLTGAMRAYFLEDKSGYPAPHAISIFRNLAWRLLLLELWSKSMGVNADAG